MTGTWDPRRVATVVIAVAAVLFVPPLVARSVLSSDTTAANATADSTEDLTGSDGSAGGSDGSDPEAAPAGGDGPTVELNPEDLSVFEQFFPDQPGAIELSETLSLWGWTPHERYGWVNNDGDKGGVVVSGGRRRSTELADPELTVWLFGGSTVFGFGQRDENTIASEMVEIAEEEGLRIRVENFGVSGWVNWQETLWFEDELRAGRKPDVAVFLDGANDTALGIERERYGLTDTAAVHFQTMTDDQRRALAEQAAARGWESEGDLDLITELAADQYRKGVQRTKDLSREFGVPVLHFWQPQLYTVPLDRPLVREALDLWGIPTASHEQLGEVVDRIAEESGVDPIDLTGIFDEADGPIFYDTSHTNEAGARITAEAIMETLLPQLRT